MRRTFAVGILVAAAGCSGSGGAGTGGGCPEPVAATVDEHALLFEGGHVEIDGSRLTSYEDATLEAWIRIDDASAGNFQIAGKGLADGSPAFAMMIRNGDRISGGFAQPGGSFEMSSVAGSNVPAGEWAHVAVAWSTSSLAFFVNGSVVVNTTTLTGPETASDTPIFIGGGLDEDLAGAPFSGAIDEVRLWAGARDGGAILAEYQTMLTGAEPGLLAAWNFEESGKRVADLAPAASCGAFKGDVHRIGDTPF